MSEQAVPDAAAGSTSTALAAVELRGITKRFPCVVANRDITVRVATGSVHAIVAENGPGKSTLMKSRGWFVVSDLAGVLGGLEGAPR